ncbi:MAG: TIGR00269 family protein, partial [Candidatus Aenigmatarchaeota archaeon]
DNEKFVPRVKPFRNVLEREVALYGKLNDLELHQDECPYVEDSLRFDVRDFLNEMEEKHPSTKYTALRAFDKLLPVIRNKYSSEEVGLSECSECGEPTSGDVCKACQLLEEV